MLDGATDSLLGRLDSEIDSTESFGALEGHEQAATEAANPHRS